jgi:hypothetical protein
MKAPSLLKKKEKKEEGKEFKAYMMTRAENLDLISIRW